jgi:hypothetical protein
MGPVGDNRILPWRSFLVAPFCGTFQNFHKQPEALSEREQEVHKTKITVMVWFIRNVDLGSVWPIHNPASPPVASCPAVCFFSVPNPHKHTILVKGAVEFFRHSDLLVEFGVGLERSGLEKFEKGGGRLVQRRKRTCLVCPASSVHGPEAGGSFGHQGLEAGLRKFATVVGA